MAANDGLLRSDERYERAVIQLADARAHQEALGERCQRLAKEATEAHSAFKMQQLIAIKAVMEKDRWIVAACLGWAVAIIIGALYLP